MTIYGARVECVVGSFAVSKSHCVVTSKALISCKRFSEIVWESDRSLFTKEPLFRGRCAIG